MGRSRIGQDALGNECHLLFLLHRDDACPLGRVSVRVLLVHSDRCGLARTRIVQALQIRLDLLLALGLDSLMTDGGFFVRLFVRQRREEEEWGVTCTTCADGAELGASVKM